MEFITTALAANRQPTQSATAQLILRNGKAFRTLLDGKGKRTKWGLEYERQSGNELPAGSFDPTQELRRMGDVEFIETRGGSNGGMDKVVRRFDPATRKWKYTALGRTFFGIKRIEFVVRIPALFAGTRSHGEAFSRHGLFPVTNIQIPGGTPEAQRDSRIKAAVK